MKNSIKVSFNFSFKGERHSPSSVLDLDKMMERSGDFSQIDFHVAKENGIDTYSYLFEVMQMTPAEFSEPGGLAEEFYRDNSFDFEAFKQAHNEQKIIQQLQTIAGDIDLEENEAVRKALLEAYRLGAQQR